MTADNREYRSLLAGVLGDPADDVRRLILADWLDDHGDTTRAEFIRVQILLAKAAKAEGRPEDGMRRLGWLMATCRERKVIGSVIGDQVHHDRECELCLQRRQQELWSGGIGNKFIGELGKCWEGGRDYKRLLCDNHDRVWRPGGRVEFVVGRGFVGAVAMPLEAFEEHAADLFASCPVTDVWLTDLRPFNHDDFRFGWALDTNDTPKVSWRASGGIFGKLPPTSEKFRPWIRHPRYRWYESERAAWDAMSSACVAFGREAARAVYVGPVKAESQAVAIDTAPSG